MKGKKRAAEAEELNLVPIMNLVTILIPFLLMAAQFVSYAVIDSTLPAIGPPVPVEEEPEEKPLNLRIMITDEGFTVAGEHPELKNEGGGEEGEDKGSTIECLTPGCTFNDSADPPETADVAYDVTQLRSLLGRIKDDKPEEKNVILVPDSDLPYGVLVMAMDATREDPEAGGTTEADAGCNGRCLFPFVVIAGGVQGATDGGE
ncbi:MAG: ExbD/TolR family protein [Myxococcota bacterium]